MNNNFICESDKYTISATNTIAISVHLDNLPNKLVINDNNLFLKKSFHISLVCINEIIKKYNVIITNFKDLVIKDFCDFIKKEEIKLLNYKNNFKFAEQDDLKTIIVMCEVSNLHNFFKLINQKYQLEIEYPPTHVTLYTLESKAGIFLTDNEDIKNLTKPIENPIGQLL